MKKTFKFAVMALAMLTVVACNNKKEEPTPEDPKDPEYVAPITIDGNLSEWDTITGVVYQHFTEETDFPAFSDLKVYADEVYIYIAAIFDTEVVDINEDLSDEEFTDKVGVPFHIYFNTGKNEGYNGLFSDPANMMTEGFLFKEGQPYDYKESATAWKWVLADEVSDDWDNGYEETTASNFIGKNVTTTGGVIEMSVLRAALPVQLENNFKLGIDIQQAWDAVGIMPNAVVTEENPQPAMMTVTTNKATYK